MSTLVGILYRAKACLAIIKDFSNGLVDVSYVCHFTLGVVYETMGQVRSLEVNSACTLARRSLSTMCRRVVRCLAVSRSIDLGDGGGGGGSSMGLGVGTRGCTGGATP